MKKSYEEIVINLEKKRIEQEESLREIDYSQKLLKDMEKLEKELSFYK